MNSPFFPLSGSFSNIYMCCNKLSPQTTKAAIKIIDTKSLTSAQIRNIQYEVNILSQLQSHSGILTLHSVYTSKTVIYMVKNLFVHSFSSLICVDYTGKNDFFTLLSPFVYINSLFVCYNLTASLSHLNSFKFRLICLTLALSSPLPCRC